MQGHSWAKVEHEGGLMFSNPTSIVCTAYCREFTHLSVNNSMISCFITSQISMTYSIDLYILLISSLLINMSSIYVWTSFVQINNCTNNVQINDVHIINHLLINVQTMYKAVNVNTSIDCPMKYTCITQMTCHTLATLCVKKSNSLD